MISPHDQSLAEQLKRTLSERASIVDFRVFGSRARGNAAADSDLDLFIEVEELNREIQKKLADIYLGLKY